MSLKVVKLLRLLLSKILLSGLRYGVAATTEHLCLLKSLSQVNTIIDIGANKGQFSLVGRYVFPNANIYSFEPLKKPAKKFNKLFESDKKAAFFHSAIGPIEEKVKMHVSNREDSSSILSIGNKQSSIFPGTEESHTDEIKVAPLNYFLSKKDLIKPVFVKIDVQGYELEVLKGSEDLLEFIDHIYVECSFVELYEGQALADEVIAYLVNYSFRLKGVYNTFYDKNGIAIQADFLFARSL